MCARGDGIRGSKDLRAEIGKFPNSTNERKQMSTKTNFKRIALVAVTALGAGVLSVAPANAGTTHPLAGAAGGNLAATTLIMATATTASTTGSVVSNDVTTGSTNRSTGLLYKDTQDGTAQNATVLSTGALALYTLGDSDVAFVASGGAFSGGSIKNLAAITSSISSDRKTFVALGSTDSAVSVAWSSSTVGTYQISLYRGNAIDGQTTATDGTLVGLMTVTVVATNTGGTYNAAESACVLQVTQAAVAKGDQDASGASLRVNAAKAYITFDLRDAYGVALPTGAVVATATNGALVKFEAATAGAGATDVYGAAAPTDKYLNISQPTANAPVSTTVTITYNGTTVCTKSVAIAGEVASMKASSIKTGDLSTATANGFKIQTFDSAGNLVLPRASAAFVAASASLNSTVSAASISDAATMLTGDTTDAYSTGTFTCGSTAGSSAFVLAYQNASGTVVTSSPIATRCADNPYKYTASFDKASYVQGEIATLTVQFLDVKGNKSNQLTTGAASAVVTSPMLTMVGTPVVNALPDANGQVKFTFTVGTTTGITTGSYNALVNFPTLVDAETATIQTVAYKVTTGDSGVTNAEVLKSIVALIASINKQIQALQKLILKR